MRLLHLDSPVCAKGGKRHRRHQTRRPGKTPHQLFRCACDAVGVPWEGDTRQAPCRKRPRSTVNVVAREKISSHRRSRSANQRRRKALVARSQDWRRNATALARTCEIVEDKRYGQAQEKAGLYSPVQGAPEEVSCDGSLVVAITDVVRYIFENITNARVACVRCCFLYPNAEA